MKVEDLEIYRLASQIADEVWEIVLKWNYFEKNGLGRQWTDAADSIDSNISEGFGRLSAKDNRRFCLFARGSLYETINDLNKAFRRNLIDEPTFKRLESECLNLKVKLWNYIKALEKNIENK
jgi:four helix bundle protein